LGRRFSWVGGVVMRMCEERLSEGVRGVGWDWDGDWDGVGM